MMIVRILRRLFRRKKEYPERIYIIDRHIRIEYELWGESEIKASIYRIRYTDGIPDDEKVEQVIMKRGDSLNVDWKVVSDRNEMMEVFDILEDK